MQDSMCTGEIMPISNSLFGLTVDILVFLLTLFQSIYFVYELYHDLIDVSFCIKKITALLD